MQKAARGTAFACLARFRNGHKAASRMKKPYPALVRELLVSLDVSGTDESAARG
jgi:hypothetical protein